MTGCTRPLDSSVIASWFLSLFMFALFYPGKLQPAGLQWCRIDARKRELSLKGRVKDGSFRVESSTEVLMEPVG